MSFHLPELRLGLSAAMLVFVALASCDRTRPASGSGADSASTSQSTPSATPPPNPSGDAPLAAQIGECPMEIHPGRALGPVRIGHKREDLDKLGLPVKVKSKHDDTEFVEVGPYHVELCGGV